MLDLVNLGAPAQAEPVLRDRGEARGRALASRAVIGG